MTNYEDFADSILSSRDFVVFLVMDATYTKRSNKRKIWSNFKSVMTVPSGINCRFVSKYFDINFKLKQHIRKRENL